jgi:lipoprotein-anchoring transpeptidase ErfK/SrfK
MHRRALLALAAGTAFGLTSIKAEAAYYHGAEYAYYETWEAPGTIIVDTGERWLYLVLGDGEAIRYGVAVGKEGFEWSGIARIGRKVEWPSWTPPKDMIARRPELAEYANGMPGGPDNPLGARALYLFQNKRDTLFRIHGTNEPQSIRKAASSGCIRMLNEEVIDLYDQVRVGTKVIVL